MAIVAVAALGLGACRHHGDDKRIVSIVRDEIEIQVLYEKIRVSELEIQELREHIYKLQVTYNQPRL